MSRTSVLALFQSVELTAFFIMLLREPILVQFSTAFYLYSCEKLKIVEVLATNGRLRCRFCIPSSPKFLIQLEVDTQSSGAKAAVMSFKALNVTETRAGGILVCFRTVGGTDSFGNNHHNFI